MSEFSEARPTDGPSDGAPRVAHGPVPDPNETPPLADAASASSSLDEHGGQAADTAPRSPLATAHDPWGSARAPENPHRAVWPTINSWRTPLVPPAPPPVPPGSAPAATGSGGRSWLGVALVAALVGAVIGGAIGVSAARIARPGPSSAQITIRYGTALPGAAILASGTSIPKLVEAVSPSVVSIDVETGFGSDEGTGMIISSNGLVVTNNHVVAALMSAGGGQVTVTRTGAREALSATLLGTSQRYDVALLQIQNASGLPAITFGNSSRLVVGDGVVAIGNALGLAAGTPTVTSGIVSALGRTVSASNAQTGASETLFGMIQTDAAINPGNSGGPLIDSSGQVVGMNTAVAGATSDGGTAQNIGFAIPSARIKHLLAPLMRMHLPTTPRRMGSYLGVWDETSFSGIAGPGQHSVAQGAVVESVVPGDPAQKAGMKTGDVIVSIRGMKIRTSTDVAGVMVTLKPGTTVPVVVERGSHQLTLEVTVIARPGG
jgi:putative serine protease PepD